MSKHADVPAWKAAVLIAGFGFGVGVLVSVSMARHWPLFLVCPAYCAVAITLSAIIMRRRIGLLGASLIAASLVALGMVLYRVT